MLERVNRDISSAINIEELKQFANITGNVRDAELQVILNSAICKVEDIADVSLSTNTFLYSSNYPTKMVKAKTKAKNGAPFVVDRNRGEIELASEVYGGCYGRLSVNLYVNSIAQKDPRTKKDLPPIHYVTCYLNGFQKTKDGDSFGGGRRARPEDVFSAIEDEGSDLL